MKVVRLVVRDDTADKERSYICTYQDLVHHMQ